jgi:hypothetical protein
LQCPACGGIAARSSARYCLTCGKLLGEDYQPLDTLRSSYRLQGKAFLIENAGTREMTDLFEINRNPVSEMAWACFVYSLVPYIGIIFVPFTVLIGFAGVGVFVRKPSAGGWKLSAASIGLSFFVAGAQVFLWWLLYIIPKLGRTI